MPEIADPELDGQRARPETEPTPLFDDVLRRQNTQAADTVTSPPAENGPPSISVSSS